MFACKINKRAHNKFTPSAWQVRNSHIVSVVRLYAMNEKNNFSMGVFSFCSRAIWLFYSHFLLLECLMVKHFCFSCCCCYPFCLTLLFSHRMALPYTLNYYYTFQSVYLAFVVVYYYCHASSNWHRPAQQNETKKSCSIAAALVNSVWVSVSVSVLSMCYASSIMMFIPFHSQSKQFILCVRYLSHLVFSRLNYINPVTNGL